MRLTVYGATKYLWIFATASAVVLYVAVPLWPHAVAHFPWRWWASPLFLLVTAFLFVFMSNRRGAWSLAIFTPLLMLYLFVEGSLGALLYTVVVQHRLERLEGYPFIGLMNVYMQMPTVLTFAAFGALHIILRRASRV